MAQSKSGFTLAEGEQVVMELEAELYAVSANPIAQTLGEIKKIIDLILGNKKKSYILITNKRVVEIYDRIACYVFKVERRICNILPSSILDVGYYRRAAFGFLCPAFYFFYNRHSNLGRVILLKNADEAEAAKITNAFYTSVMAVKQ